MDEFYGELEFLMVHSRLCWASQPTGPLVSHLEERSSCAGIFRKWHDFVR